MFFVCHTTLNKVYLILSYLILYFSWNFPQLPGYPSLHCEYMGIGYVFNNSLLKHAKFATGSPITIWAPKQNCRKVWLKVQYLVSWHPIENQLPLYKSCLLTLRKTRGWGAVSNFFCFFFSTKVRNLNIICEDLIQNLTETASHPWS